MSNGNSPGAKKLMKITLSAEGYATSVREWYVDEDLVRPYAVAYDAWIAKGGLEISKAMYELMGDDSGIEAVAGKVMGDVVR